MPPPTLDAASLRNLLTKIDSLTTQTTKLMSILEKTYTGKGKPAIDKESEKMLKRQQALIKQEEKLRKEQLKLFNITKKESRRKTKEDKKDRSTTREDRKKWLKFLDKLHKEREKRKISREKKEEQSKKDHFKKQAPLMYKLYDNKFFKPFVKSWNWFTSTKLYNGLRDAWSRATGVFNKHLYDVLGELGDFVDIGKSILKFALGTVMDISKLVFKGISLPFKRFFGESSKQIKEEKKQTGWLKRIFGSLSKKGVAEDMGTSTMLKFKKIFGGKKDDKKEEGGFLSTLGSIFIGLPGVLKTILIGAGLFAIFESLPDDIKESIKSGIMTFGSSIATTLRPQIDLIVNILRAMSGTLMVIAASKTLGNLGSGGLFNKGGKTPPTTGGFGGGVGGAVRRAGTGGVAEGVGKGGLLRTIGQAVRGSALTGALKLGIAGGVIEGVTTYFETGSAAQSILGGGLGTGLGIAGAMIPIPGVNVIASMVLGYAGTKIGQAIGKWWDKRGLEFLDKSTNANYAMMVAKQESSGKNVIAKSPSQSASGYFGFTKDTWKLYGGSTEYAYQSSKEEQLAVFERYTQDMANRLQQAGLGVTPRNLYLCHHFGPGIIKDLKREAAGASDFIPSVYTPRVLSANPHLSKLSTMKDLGNWAESKFVNANLPVPTSASPVGDVDERSKYALEPTFRSKVESLFTDFRSRYGRDPVIVSGVRDWEKQVNTKSSKPGLAADPGKSRHQYRAAIDIHRDDLPYIQQLMKQKDYGLENVKGEPWHFQERGVTLDQAIARNGGIPFGGLPVGYKTLPEAIQAFKGGSPLGTSYASSTTGFPSMDSIIGALSIPSMDSIANDIISQSFVGDSPFDVLKSVKIPTAASGGNPFDVLFDRVKGAQKMVESTIGMKTDDIVKTVKDPGKIKDIAGGGKSFIEGMNIPGMLKGKMDENIPKNFLMDNITKEVSGGMGGIIGGASGIMSSLGIPGGNLLNDAQTKMGDVMSKVSTLNPSELLSGAQKNIGGGLEKFGNAEGTLQQLEGSFNKPEEQEPQQSSGNSMNVSQGGSNNVSQSNSDGGGDKKEPPASMWDTMQFAFLNIQMA